MANDEEPPPNIVIQIIFGCLLKLFVLTPPKFLNFHRLQAPLIDLIRPGNWLYKLVGYKGNSKQSEVSVNCEYAATVFEHLQNIGSVTTQISTLTGNEELVDADFVVPKQKIGEDNTFKIYFFTRNKQWLDIMEWKRVGGGEEGKCRLKVNSFSACIAPAGLPFSWLIGVAMFWFPFQDVGQNKAHIRICCRFLTDQGLGVEMESAKNVTQVSAEKPAQ